MDIDAMISRMQKAKVKDIVRESVHETRMDLVKIQRLQMLHGENSLGHKIGIYASAKGKKKKATYGTYAMKKHIMNALPGLGFVDLRFTGDFYREIFIDDRDNYVVIGSADSKTGDLVKKYGEEIFGLNDTWSIEYSVHYLGPMITEQFKKILQG